MRKSNKKGFTIVELVIVIAVIAILAAVLIPTFAGLIQKANQSADIQAVRQMNTVLATYPDGTIKTVFDAVAALDKESIDLDNYKPLQKDHYFYFVIGKNGVPTIIYTDKNDNIVFNQDMKDNVTGQQWMSLSGDVPTDDNYSIDDAGAVSIDSGAKLAHLIEAKKNTSDNLTITLSGNVDLKGAAVDFGTTTGTITITGGTSGAVLSGIRADDNTVSPTSGEFANHHYGFGLFGNIKSGTVKLENVTISDLNVGNSLGTHEGGANTTGLIAGYISAGATVELTDVTFKNCTVNGYQKVGGVVGQLYGTLKMNNVKFENVTVNGYCEVAKIAGVTFKQDSAYLTVDNCNFDGIAVCGKTDLDPDKVFTKTQLSNVTLNGNENNTFCNYEGTHLWGGATNDWTWYETSQPSATVNDQSYTLNKWTESTSKNIEKGSPAND